MQCRVTGCERAAHYKATELCQMHYFRVRRNGTTDFVERGRKERVETPSGYQWIYRPDHPLHHASSGYVAEHRAVVYQDLGEGPLACELCARALTWKTCNVDHIDGDVRNNARSNLRPTCSRCNTWRSMSPAVEWSRTHVLEHDGLRLTPTEWARDPRVLVAGRTIVLRKQAGMTDAEALFMPKVTHNGRKREMTGAPKPHRPITARGLTMTPSQWAKQPGVLVSNVTIRNRLAKGKSVEEAIFNPPSDTGAKTRDLQKAAA